MARTQQLNAAYEILSNPERRHAHDRELEAHQKSSVKARTAASPRHISRDVNLPLEEFLRGTTREVRVHDPSNPDGAEIYELIIPPDTAPGTRFRLPRSGSFAGGFVHLRVKALPHFRFKVRGGDLRCDLKISPQRALQGGQEMVRGISGAVLRVAIPRGAGRGEVLRIPGEGLPRPRGGRGDLFVRVIYRLEVRVTRRPGQ